MLGGRKEIVRANAHFRWLVMAAFVFSGAAFAAPQDSTSSNYDTQDARLNAAYRKLSQSLDDAGRKSLRDEERQWIASRDKACGVASGSVAKNDCTTDQTRARADELEKRLASAPSKTSGASKGAVAGDWGYRSDCNVGHYAELGVANAGAAPEGTWSDGTRTSGEQGQFKGEWRDGKLYLRFCAETEERGGYPVCPAFGDVDAYVVPEGKRLAWYRVDGPASENHFKHYVTLDRVPKGGKAPLDTQCKDD